MIDDGTATVRGEGESLLFLPGFLCERSVFQNQIEYFSRFYRVVALDMPGFGNVKATKPLTLEDYAAYVSQKIDELCVPPVKVVAHSFGCRVLLKLLPDERFSKLVITGGAGLKPKRGIKYRLKVAVHKAKRFLHINTERDGSDDYRRLDGIMKQTFVSVVNEFLDYKLKSVDNRALLVWGENDKETPLYLAKRMNAGLKNSSLVVVKNAGHFVFLDKPASFNFLVKDFLS